MQSFQDYIVSSAPAFYYRLEEEDGYYHPTVGPLPLLPYGPQVRGVGGLVASENGRAVQFHDPAGGASSTEDSRLNFHNDFTGMALVQFESASFSTYFTVRDIAENRDKILFVFTKGRMSPGDLSVEMRDWETTTTRVRTPGPMNDGKPHIVFAQYSRTLDRLSLIVDGLLVDERTQINRPISTNRAVHVGNNVGSNQGMDGVIDSVAMWDRLLSSEEMTALSALALEGGSHFTATARLPDGTPARRVVVRDWYTHRHVGSVKPNPLGEYSILLPRGTYDVTWFADGCPPLCHGPYSIE